METKENWNETCNFGQLLTFTAFLCLLSQGSLSLDDIAGQEEGKLPWVGLPLGLLAEASSPAPEPWGAQTVGPEELPGLCSPEGLFGALRAQKTGVPHKVQFCVRLHVTTAV